MAFVVVMVVVVMVVVVVVCDPYGTFEMLKSSLDYLSQEEFIGAASDELVAWCRDIPSAIRACNP
jgi:hypothetical protein